MQMFFKIFPDIEYFNVGVLFAINNPNKINNIAINRRKIEGKGCPLCDYRGYLYNEDGKSFMCSCTKDKFFREIYIKANGLEEEVNKKIDAIFAAKGLKRERLRSA